MHWATLSDTGTGAGDFQQTAGQDAQGRGFGGSSRLVAGFANGASGTSGILRRFDGSNWTTIDTFATRGYGVVEVGSQIVVVGGIDANGKEHVVTRISTDGGQSFSPLDEYEYVSGNAAHSMGVTADPAGNVYAAISAPDATNVNHWIVRKLACQ